MAVCRPAPLPDERGGPVYPGRAGHGGHGRAGREPAGLVDLGTGAGLGLHLDRYRYLVGGPAVRAGDGRADPGAVRCAGRATPPPAVLPPIAGRAGIEASPVDLHDPAARSWLLACAPPEASALARLTAAIAVARQDPARIVAGDVIAELPGVLASFPPDRPVTVVDAYLAVFLSPGQRAELAGILAAAAPEPPGDLAVARPAGPARPGRPRQRPGPPAARRAGRRLPARRRLRRARGAHLPRRRRPRPAAGPRPPVRPVGRVARRRAGPASAQAQPSPSRPAKADSSARCSSRLAAETPSTSRVTPSSARASTSAADMSMAPQRVYSSAPGPGPPPAPPPA